MRFVVPATTSPGRAPLGCGPSDPAAVPLVGCLTPPAVSRQARARGGVSRRCRPGPFPVQSLPLARSTFTPLGVAASLAVGHRSRLVRRPCPGSPGFPRRPPPCGRADGRDLEAVAWFPPGLVRPFPRDRVEAIALPRRLRARPPASPGYFASSLGLGALLRARVRSRVAAVSRRLAAVALLGSPLQSLRPVLCSGPSCPARSPRACARASRRPGSLTQVVGGEPLPSVLREVHEGDEARLGDRRRASPATVPPLGGSP